MASTPSPGGSDVWPASPSSGGPHSAKAKRYDRQLRLWGDHGQTALERSRVCVINATATATEVLKALVLPGVGQFTIVDGHKISGEDVGNNFFLEKDQIGKWRGSVATRQLLELNPEVRGDCVEVTPSQILSDRPDFFLSFNLVIATDLEEDSLVAISRLLWENQVPLIVIKSFGLLGYLRIQVKEHAVIESHPDNLLEDLRLDKPFPALKTYMDSVDLDSMDKNSHMHTPFLIILYKYLNKWREEKGARPKNYKEKLAFKDFIRSGIIRNEDGLPEDEENFEEAIKAVNTALESTTIPSHVQTILNDEKCLNLDAKSIDFWIIARAVKEFVDNEGQGLLPVRGSIPDMFSDSKRYIEVQNLYREKASQDAEEVLKRVRCNLEIIGRPAESISETDVKKFCKEASNVRLVRSGNSIFEEYSGKMTPTSESFDWTNELEHNPDSEATYYLILRGVDRFRKEFSTIPGALEVEPDIGRLKNCVARVLGDYHVSNMSIKDDYIHEVCRYGGAEPHAIAAFMGGCAAQEVIKLLTNQYVPVDNLFLFNTMTSSTMTLKI